MEANFKFSQIFIFMLCYLRKCQTYLEHLKIKSRLYFEQQFDLETSVTQLYSGAVHTRLKKIWKQGFHSENP